MKELFKEIKDISIRDDELDDLVHDAKAAEASDVNNAGVDAQLEYLLEANGEQFIRSLLSSLKKKYAKKGR